MQRALLLIISLLFSYVLFAVTPIQREYISLHQQAEAAMHKREYLLAKEHYATLIEMMEEEREGRVDWQHYADAILRYSEALIELHEFKEAEHCLNRFLARNPPHQYRGMILLLRARTKTGPEGLMHSYKDMMSLQKEWPLSEWPSTSRLFFRSVEISLNDYFDALVKKAHLLYVAQDYAQALPLYQEIEKAIKTGSYPKANTRGSLTKKKVQLELAHTIYKLADYNSLLTPIAEKDTIDGEILYLIAQVHKELHNYHSAIALFENASEKTKKHDLEEYLQASYELATLYFKHGSYLTAKGYLEKIITQGDPKHKLVLFAMTMLAEIQLQEGALSAAEELLLHVTRTGVHKKQLLARASFLQGQLLIKKKEYTQAITCLNRALSLNSGSKENIALCLVECYLYSKDYIQAEKLLNYLLTTKEREQALLWLGYLQITNKNYDLAISLLSDHFSSFSLEQQLLAHLLLSTLPGQEDHVLTATHINYAHCNLYSYSWLYKGIVEYKKEEKSQALHSFETALALKKELPKLMCNLALEELLSLSFNEDSEVDLYAQGLLLSYLDRIEEAVVLFEQLLSGSYREKAYYRLGLLYYGNKQFIKAKECFLALSELNPSSEIAAAAWYWAAESEEQLQSNSLYSSTCRTHLFTEYPDSVLSAEAYFKFFSLDDYIEGKQQALAHLSHFSTLFPHSTLNVAAYYFLSLHQNNKEKSIEVLERALAAFSPEYQSEGILYFRTKAILRMAMLYETIDIDRSILLLKPLIQELEQKEEYGFLLEECRFSLAKSYLKHQKIHKAQKLFLEILETSARYGIQTGYILALTWQEQGNLALAAGEPSTALHNYELALKSGQHHLNTTQILRLETLCTTLRAKYS
jgi:tetratricopeptide (TPR) repeat protein